MRVRVSLAAVIIITLLITIPAAAQGVANPTRLRFTASSEHAAVAPITLEPLVTSYRAKYFPASACVLGTGKDQCPATGEAFTLQLGKPAPVGGDITVENVFGGIVLNTLYKAVVEAVGPGGARASTASNPFGNQTLAAPAAPGTPVAERAGS